MISVDRSQYLWFEKYRPKTLEECILPEEMKNTFRKFVEEGQIPHFIFFGTAGIGKTTVARALCNDIGAEYIMINGSDEGRYIDQLRDKVKSFASTVSLTDSKKVIIIDEADYLNAQSVQPFLRGFMEEFSANCRFILTCNYINRIIPALQESRCTQVSFKVDTKDKQRMLAYFFKRASSILQEEHIEFDKKVLVELVTKNFPDYRKTLNELQRSSVSGNIDSSVLLNASENTFTTLVGLLKDKNFRETRLWVGVNVDIETAVLFRNLYDKAYDLLEPQSIPEMIIILGNYQYKAAFVADSEINTMCALTEIMMSCQFK